MFSFSITDQLVVFLQSLGFGLLMGFLYSLTDFVSGLIFSVKIRYIVSDVVFCVQFAFFLFCFVLSYNLGKLRLYLIIGVFLGVLLYVFSFGEIISHFFGLFSDLMRKLRYIMFSPFRYLKKLIITSAGKFHVIFDTKLKKSIAKENKSSV